MAAISNRSFCALPAWLKGAFSREDAVLVALVLALAVISFWPDPTVADHVHADTSDYALPSLNFLHGEGFVIIANGHKYPPTHTFGLPLLLTVAYAALGTQVGNGGYLVFLFGLATILLTYNLAKALFDRRVAVVACVLLAVASQYRFYAKVIAPDGSVSAFFCLASLVLLFAALRNPQSSLWIWALLGQSLGFALTVRPDNVLLLLPSAVLLILHIRGQNRACTKVTVFASGILFWGMLILLANFLYTGDWLRTGYAVNFSAQNDRVGGSVSWRYFLIPSFWESNFVKLLRGAFFQWSLLDAEVDSVKRCFYYATDVFLGVGLIQIIRVSKRETEKRDFLIWSSLWFLSLVLFFSCYFFPTDNPRYLQRVVPSLCLFTAVGLITCWDLVAQLRAPPRLRWLLVWPFRVFLMASFGGAVVHMLFHPYVAPFARVPQTAYMQHVKDLIPEKSAMILTDWPVLWMEYFVVGDSERTVIPLNPFDSGADSYVQWKRPPHPEWINEDCQKRDNTGTVRYKRMYQNGAQDLYPHTVLTTPEVITEALRSGRSVYLVTQVGHNNRDINALILLFYRCNLELVESGWLPKHETPKDVRDITGSFTIAKISEKQTPGIRIRNTPEGQIVFETENGIGYSFAGHMERSLEDNTEFRIMWSDERHSEEVFRFTPDGRIEITQ